MKKILASMMVVLLFLSSCSFLGISPNSDSVMIGNTEYRTGFYGSLYPQDFELGESVQAENGQTLHRVKSEQFDWVHSNRGKYSSGTLYCRDSQWEGTKAYYEEEDNFYYYLGVGENGEKKISLTDVNAEKFNALLEFAEQSGYDPFDVTRNETIKKVELPMPDFDESPELIPYKDSHDGYFTSMQYRFHIINDTLFLTFFYDYSDAEAEKLKAVPVPKELNEYFVPFFSNAINLAE